MSYRDFKDIFGYGKHGEQNGSANYELRIALMSRWLGGSALLPPQLLQVPPLPSPLPPHHLLEAHVRVLHLLAELLLEVPPLLQETALGIPPAELLRPLLNPESPGSRDPDAGHHSQPYRALGAAAPRAPLESSPPDV